MQRVNPHRVSTRQGIPPAQDTENTLILPVFESVDILAYGIQTPQIEIAVIPPGRLVSQTA